MFASDTPMPRTEEARGLTLPTWISDRTEKLEARGFSLTPVPHPLLTMNSGGLHKVEIDGETFELYIADEYKDLETEHPAIQAEVVFRACSEYMEHETSDNWVRSEGIPPRCHLVVKMRWDEDRKAAEALFDKLAFTDGDVTDLDWQLNAGRAAELRSLKYRRA